MYQIQNITDDPKQKQTLVLPDGTQIQISYYYVPNQQSWFIRTLTYDTFILQGIRICNSPNLLYQFRNQIPFGLACFSTLAKREPMLQEDFSTGESKLYILTAEEVNQYTDYLSGQV